jgi:hypothetical protein
MGLRRRGKGRVLRDVQFLGAYLEPSALTAHRRRSLDLAQTEHVNVEPARLANAAEGRQNLNVIEAGNAQGASGYVALDADANGRDPYRNR